MIMCNCQRMSDFDSCQFIFLRMAYLAERLMSICARSNILHLTSAYMKCTGGRVGVRYVIAKCSLIDYQIFLPRCSAIKTN